MIFHSLDFVVFFLVTTAVYWCLPRRGQNLLLLLASYFFYGYVHTWFLTLIVATTVVDYLAARGMDAWPGRRRLMLGLSLAVNLGLLGFFKYFNFFADNVHAALSVVGLDVPMPAGPLERPPLGSRLTRTGDLVQRDRRECRAGAPGNGVGFRSLRQRPQPVPATRAGGCQAHAAVGMAGGEGGTGIQGGEVVSRRFGPKGGRHPRLFLRPLRVLQSLRQEKPTPRAV